MGGEFAEFHDELRSVAREILGGSVPGSVVAPAEMAAAGWSGLDVPEEFGGAGTTFAELAVVMEEAGRAAASTALLGSAVGGVAALLLVEPTPARDRLLTEVVTGECTLALALVADGDDMACAAPPFTLEASGTQVMLRGRADYVPDAPSADTLLVLAMAPGEEPVVVAVRPPLDRLEVIQQPLVDATRRVGAVKADGVAVSAGEMWHFARAPEACVRRLFDRCSIAVACDSLGVADAMLAATVAHVKDREQFDRPIGSFQAVKHMCADMAVDVAVTRRLVTDAVELLADADDGPAAVPDRPDEISVAASMAKSAAGEAAVRVAGTAMQLHGGMGYTWESGIHAYLKRAVLNRSLYGSPVSHRSLLARRYGSRQTQGGISHRRPGEDVHEGHR